MWTLFALPLVHFAAVFFVVVIQWNRGHDW
jgi:hypothetical protein